MNTMYTRFDTKLLQRALAFAEKVHKDQSRKLEDEPYINHCTGVASLIASVSDDEDLIAAGLLHDTIEDCEPYGSVTTDTLSNEFNSRIARLVDSVTEPAKADTWVQRKAAAVRHISTLAPDELTLKSADVLHNVRSITQYVDRGDEMNVFNTLFKGGRDATFAYFIDAIDAIGQKDASTALYSQLLVEREKLVGYLSD